MTWDRGRGEEMGEGIGGIGEVFDDDDRIEDNVMGFLGT